MAAARRVGESTRTAPAGGLRHVDGLDRLGDGADLVDLEQQRVARLPRESPTGRAHTARTSRCGPTLAPALSLASAPLPRAPDRAMAFCSHPRLLPRASSCR
eukprot:4315503-Prymnesium_polylepis.1